MIITTIARHTAVRWVSWSTVTRKVTHQVSQCRRRPASSLAQSISMLKFNTRAISTSSYLNADAKEGDGFRIISPTASKDAPVKKGTPTINVTFILQSGERLTAKGREGDTLLDVVVDNELDIDGYGACEGTLACSTCHLILKQADFDALPNGPTDEEMDMLDLAYDLTETSRLGCQIYLSKEMDGLEVEVPASVNDVRLT